MKHHISCRKRIAALAALGCAFAHAYVNDAGKVVVGTREIMTVEVSAAETWDKPVVVCGVLRKTGAGKLTILAEKMYGAGRIDVAEGELEITATGAGSAMFAEPTSVMMSGAAMWLDASMHVAGADGAAATGDAVAWYDVRETDWATPGFTTNYIHAQAYTNLSTGGLWPQVGTDASARPYVDFGGVSSGQYMTWRTPSGVKAWIPVAHSFVVYSPNGSHGHVLGSATSPSESGSKVMYFATSGGSNGTTLFQFQPDNNMHFLRLGRVFRDGVQTDSAAAIDTSATQLIETEAYRPDAMAEAFFNFRNYQQAAGSYSFGNRAGGGRLHEVLIFTNALSEVDRILIEQRLLRKWIKTSGYAAIPPEMTVAAGATLTLPAAVAGSTKVKSKGTLRCPGATVPTLNAIDPFAVSGQVVLDAGVTVSNRALMAVVPQSGKTYAVDAWNTLTVSSGAAGQTDKTGVGSLAFADFGDATKFSFSEGLASVHVTTGMPCSVPANCIADGGFEGIYTGTGNPTYADGTQIGAWYVTNFCGSANTRITYKTAWSSVMWQSGKVLGAPEGDYYLVFKNGGGARQPFSIDKAGRYEVRLRCYPRSDSNTYAGFARVYIDGHSLGTVQCRHGEADWDAARLFSPYLEAGDHVLALMSEVNVDLAIGIDDVRVTLLDEERDSSVVANGNFEDINWTVFTVGNSATERGKVASTINSTNIMPTAYLKGWTATGAAYLLRRLPYLRSSDDFIGPDNDSGCVSIVLTNGTVLSQSVTIPATGLYRLHAKAARYRHPGVAEYVGLTLASTYTNGKASLALGGTSEEFTIREWALTDFALSHAVLLSEGDVVTISVASTDVEGLVNTIVLDDVRLVRESNLVNNGGFEQGSDSPSALSGWTLVANPKTKYLRYSGYQEHFGAEPVEGVARCRIHAGTHIAQTIPLDAGYYWLSFWDVSRSESYPSGFKVQYGPAAITVTLANGSVTNFCETVVPSSNCVEFIRREFLVKVESSGNWTLGFEGETSDRDISSLIDAVSLRPASDVEVHAVPAAAKDVELSIAAGAKLALNYVGTQTVERVSLGGRSYVGELTASAVPDFLEGPGALFCLPKGTMVIFR